MRALTAAASLAAVASVVTVSLATATPVPTQAAAVPTAAAAATCRTEIDALSRDDRYHSVALTHDVSDPPTVVDYGPVGGTFQTLATGNIDFGDPAQQIYSETWHFGTTNSLYLVRAHHDLITNERSVSAQLVASRWGGFRRLVHSGQLGERTNTLYGLHTNGSLYRYQVTWDSSGTPSVAGYGNVTGFGDLRTMTLISHTSSYDALLANTTTGQLIMIKIPATPTMQATSTVIRARTWGGLDQFAIGVCNSGTMLVATNSATGAAYGYQLAFLNGTSTPITSLGQLQGTWPYDILTNSFEIGVSPNGA